MEQIKKKIGVGLLGLIIMLTHSGQVEAKHLIASRMTREKLAVQLVEELGLNGVARNNAYKALFSDVTSNEGAIELLGELGILAGVGEGKFNPKGIVTDEVEIIVRQRIQDRLQRHTPWRHGFYAISSFNQMEKIEMFDGVSFGWSEVYFDKEAQRFLINTQDRRKGDFVLPSQFHIPLDFAQSKGVETYLMVFFEDKEGLANKLLTDTAASENLIDELVEYCHSVSKDGQTRSFDGLTIDFENFRDEALSVLYQQFLERLSTRLQATGKKLNVAVPPGRYFKGYDYKGIGEVANRVILMAHDYAPKRLTPFEMSIGSLHTPQTPISFIYTDLQQIIDKEIGIADKNKVILQVSFASTQWQMKENKIINAYPYTPSYDKIQERLKDENSIKAYDALSQNPYITYTQDGITNRIWYENQQSIQIKKDIAALLDIGGISYWRLGTLPDYIQ